MGLKELFEKITKNVSQEVPRSVGNGILKVASNQINIKVPYYVTDENIRKYIIDNELYDPQKLAEFIISSSIETMYDIMDSINGIKIEMCNELIDNWKGTMSNIELTLSEKDSEQKKRDVKSYIKELNKIRIEFQGKVERSICNVKEIDDKGGFERFIKASSLEKRVDTETKIAKVCLEAILKIAETQLFLSDYIDYKNYSNKIYEEFEGFIHSRNYILTKYISTMNEWSLDKDRLFWSDKIREEYEKIIEQHIGILEMFDDMREQADLENIIFT